MICLSQRSLAAAQLSLESPVPEPTDHFQETPPSDWCSPGNMPQISAPRRSQVCRASRIASTASVSNRSRSTLVPAPLGRESAGRNTCPGQAAPSNRRKQSGGLDETAGVIPERAHARALNPAPHAPLVAAQGSFPPLFARTLGCPTSSSSTAGHSRHRHTDQKSRRATSGERTLAEASVVTLTRQTRADVPPANIWKN